MSYSDDLPPNVELTTQHTVHRTASKAYSRPPGDDSRGWPRWALPVTAIIACVSLGIAAAAVAALLNFKSATSSQEAGMRDQLATMSRQLQAARTASASTVSGLAGKVNAITPVVDGMAPYGLVCAQALANSQNGAGLYYFPCTPTKP